MKKIKPELVLPGGDLSRAKIAFDFGADAVYVGLNKHSLRKGEVRFNVSEIGRAIKYAHSLNKKLYVTFNVFAHNKHLKNIEKDMKKIAALKPDAFIIADVGVMQIAKNVAPNVPPHVSTQANVTNAEQVKFYKKMGAKRIVLARELNLKEIAEIHKEVPKMELEVFAHGSMCISYSGRCLLSNYMTGRHANLGDCAQPCRWNYRLARISNGPSSLLASERAEDFRVSNKTRTNNPELKKSEINSKLKIQNSKFFLEEQQRPGEYFEIEESKDGTNIMSSQDLCTIEYIDKMLKAGITGFKVEGRNKTEYYLASTALAYREALNLSFKNKYQPKDKKRLKKELTKNAHRGYTEGFLFGKAKKGATYEGRAPIERYKYIAQITKIKKQDPSKYKVTVKNKISKNMKIEVLTPNGIFKDKILMIFNDAEKGSDLSRPQKVRPSKELPENKEISEISPGRTGQTAIVTLKNTYPQNSLLRAATDM